MKQFISIFCMIAMILSSILLTGCHRDEVNSPALQEQTTAPTSEPESYTEATSQSAEVHSLFDFSLPEGFEIQNQSEKTCDLIYEGQNVGGFVITDLDAGMVNDPDKEIIKEYLNSYVEPPLVFDCMMSSTGEDPTMLEVSLIVVNLETEETHEYKHYLFERDSECYDMWLDTELVDSETSVQLLSTTGIDDNVVYVGDEDTVYYGQGEISPDDIIRVPSSVVEVPDEMASADEDTIYYGQDEISPDEIIYVPSSTVEVPDEESTENNN